MNATDILLDSPNGYRIVTDEPSVVDDAVRYYLIQLDQFTLEDYPVEFAVSNYGLGKLLFGDTTKPKLSEERAKRIENALYHFSLALPVFNQNDYPIMFGIISIYMARLFRERANLISNRSFLADRSSPEESVLYGVDQILEAFPVFFRSKSHAIEHALCSLEAGWLYVLQSEFVDNFKDDSIREQAAMYLERAISLVYDIVGKGDKQIYTMPGDKQRRWNPLTSPVSDYPEHVRLLLEGQPFAYLEGSALYLLGRLYQGWTELNVREYAEVTGNFDRGRHKSSGGGTAQSFELQNQIKAFDYFTQAVRTKNLPRECFLWADAHHRAAVTLIKHPKVVNPDYVEHDTDINASDIHLEVALTHLNLALRCPALTGPAAMDLHFHVAQTAISRLQLIIDRVPMGQSVTKALQAHSEGLDLIRCIEHHLEEARKRVTPASTQTTQDGYLYFFSCLKISEYRMLEAACRPELQPVEREDFLTDAVEHLVDALKARSLVDNTDLHYIATVQMSQLLLAVKRSYAAAKSYAKCLLTLSAIINRSLYNPEDVQAKLSEEIVRQVGQALAAGARDVAWVKLHFGPIALNERLTAGYASWSFEDAPSVKLSDDSAALLLHDDSGIDESVYKPASTNDGAGTSSAVASSLSPIYKATPPKGVPPLKLPVGDNKKVFVSGETMHTDALKPADGASIEDGSPAAPNRKKPPPPSGPIPLFALGHTPLYDHGKAKGKPLASAAPSNYRLGPYGRRMRRRIPPAKQMATIDRDNLQTFGFRNGKPVFLLPSHLRRRGGPHKSPNPQQQRGSASPSSQFTGSKALSRNRPGSSAHDSSNGGGEVSSQNRNGGEDSQGLSEDADDEDAGGEEDDVHSEGEEGSGAGDGDGDRDEPPPTRGRSSTIRPEQGPPSRTSTGNAQAASAPPQPRGVLSWLFGGKKVRAAKNHGAAARGKPANKGFSLFGLFGKDSRREDESDEEDEHLEMWASSQCFYTYNVLSRQSRMQLVLRCSRLEALDGERTNHTLYHAKPKYVTTYHGLKKLLTRDCAKLVVPPVSMKDLSSRPFLELQTLFASQVRICRKLDDLEHLLYTKISKYDTFLPFITCAPVFTRDLAEFDKGLLNAESLIQNLANEHTLALHRADLQQKQKQKHQSSSGGPGGPLQPVQGAVEEALSKSQFAYDSVSSAHASTEVAASTAPSVSALLRQRAEEAEEVAVGKVTLSLSHCLDGANYLTNGQQDGSRDMLERYVAHDECLMIWHLPVVPSQPIQVVLVWRDHSASLHDKFSSSLHADPAGQPQSAGGKKRQKKKGKTGAGEHNKGIVMEVAKSDLDTSHLLQYIQGYLDALHSRSTPLRATMLSDALRALSCALSLTEFLHMIPPHVKSLVICCPPPLRLIPWHLLLIEQSSGTPFTADSTSAPTTPDLQKPGEIHLLEKFSVRLGPTLALFELNECGTQALRHSSGLHRLCAVDGEADGPDRSSGVRGTDLEVACVSTVWSADPDDCRVLSNDAAVPRALRTVLYGDGDNDDYRKFKQDIFVKRREKSDHVRVVPDRSDGGDFVEALKVKHEQSKSEKRRVTGGQNEGDADSKEGDGGGDNDDRNSDGSNAHSSDEDGDEGGDQETAKRNRRKLTASLQDQKALTMCRVLHLAAPKILLDEQDSGKGPEKLFAAVALPRYDSLQTFRNPKYKAKLARRNREERMDDARDRLTALDVVQQVFVKNCALCTLSRFAPTDDLHDVRSAAGWRVCDTNCEFIEALHLAGAKTVLHPLWSGNATGLAAVAHLVFQIRFYSTLSANSRSRLSVVETCRAAQLWLRDATADAVIAFIHKAPVSKAARKLIIDELDALVSASLTPAQQKLKQEAQQRATQAGALAAPSKFVSPEKSVTAVGAAPSVFVTSDGGEHLGNRVGGTVKFFAHFMYWGSFVISGAGSAVHHPDLTENRDEGFEQGHIRWDDQELNNMSMEAQMLRAEGKTEEARELERLIRQVRMDRIRRQIAAAKAAGARAGRGLLDTLDFLDKALLDQDSDSVSVSDDSVEVRRKRKEKKQNKARESDSDEYSDETGQLQSEVANGAVSAVSPRSQDAGAVSQVQRSPSKRFVPRALELGSLKPEDIAYEKWKSKVGGLSMAVRDPVLDPRKLAAAKGGAPDTYEYNMMKKVKDGGEVDEQDGYDARMEALYKKKNRSKGRRLEEGAKGSNSDDDSGESDLSERARRARRRKQLRNADRDSESEYDPSEDEASNDDGESESDSEEGLYAQRKKLRKRKELKKQGKHKKKSRFAMALQDVRGGVRSYSAVVRSITSQVPDRPRILQATSANRGTDDGAAAHGSVDEEGKCVIS